MAEYKVVDAEKLDADLSSVADAIRTKGGTSESLTFPQGFVDAVGAISSGGGESLPDWDDDSPIIATGEGYPVNAPKTWWDLTEKGTFRWHSRSTNTTASVGAVAFDAIPDNYKAICEKILQIDVEESVGSAYTVFAPNCERVRLPASVTNWKSYGLSSLKEVDMSQTSIKNFLDQMFSTQGVVTELILPETFELVPYKCFSGSPIQKINLGNIKQFNISCFENCYYLKGSITFSQSLTQIYNKAFANTRLEEIKFRQSVGNNPIIANNAFSNCKNLLDIYVPWSEGEVADAPWGATNATIHYNSEV